MFSLFSPKKKTMLNSYVLWHIPVIKNSYMYYMCLIIFDMNIIDNKVNIYNNMCQAVVLRTVLENTVLKI